MLPMGTIMAVSMVMAVLFAAYLPLLDRLAPILRKLASGWVFLAGTWNVFWYGVQHITEFWGMAALASGALMLVTSVYIYKPEKLPISVQKARPLVLLLLTACACLYGVTIYKM